MSYRTHNNSVPQNLSNDEFIALQNLSKNKDSIIQKFDKGNSMVIVGRQDYIKKIDNILSDQQKFTVVNLKYETLLKFAVNQKKKQHVDKVLRKLVESNSMTEKTRKSLKPIG